MPVSRPVTDYSMECVQKDITDRAFIKPHNLKLNTVQHMLDALLMLLTFGNDWCVTLIFSLHNVQPCSKLSILPQA